MRSDCARINVTSEGASLSSVRTKVSTGYGRLDEALHGGFVAGSMVVLNTPAGDEAPILLGNFLKTEQPSLLICRNQSSAQAIVPNAAEGMTCLVCSDKPVSPARGIMPGKGIENLTDLNLQINEALSAIQPKRLAIDILSDVLLRHKALQTRKWLNELLERLRGRGITTLAVLNPYMHTAEETQALEDVFDASIEVFQRDVEGRQRKSLRIKWAHGVEVSSRELPLEGLVAEKRGERKSELEKTRIAVLPFSNMSPDPNDQYFADGITEEIISIVSGISGLSVISRTSVMGYKGTTKKLGEIGRELDVGSILEGSVRKAGNRIRITAQLIDVVGDRHLWAQNYDRNLDDIFAVQSEIAEKVAGELRIRLVGSEKRALEKKPTENTEAYTFFLRGRELLREETEASLRQGISFFEKAIQLDPSFARAYVGMADCHLALAESGQDAYGGSLSYAKAPLDRALALDPDLPEAHSCLSGLFFDMDAVPGAEAEARKALELNPSLTEPYRVLFELAGLRGDEEEMVKQIETAYRLDPLTPHYIWLMGVAYLYTGRGQEALEFWKKTEQLAPAQSSRGMTEYYLTKGDIEKAKEFHAKFEKLEPTHPWAMWMDGFLAAYEGNGEKAKLTIKKIEEAKMGPIAFNFIAYIYHALGDLDSYFDYMNKVLETHAATPMLLMHSPLLAKARTDPRYLELAEKLRKRMGLTK
jgi:adenylate cyclase